jgi:hypothetical protein
MVVLPCWAASVKVTELPAHHLGPSDDAVDDRLVDHGP